MKQFTLRLSVWLGMALLLTYPIRVAATPTGGTVILYLPLIRNATLTPIGPLTITNPSFEGGWVTDWDDNTDLCPSGWITYSNAGNQCPNGWLATLYPPGALMPFPTKMQEGNIVPATSGGAGEYVHKLAIQLPPDEQLGQPRALILEGAVTYKAFSAVVANAIILSQTLTGSPGEYAQVTAYILGETHDQPSPPNTELENDHFVASVKLGSVADTRFYVDMVATFDVPGNERPWNKFEVTAPFPASGQLTLQIIVQQNWAGRTDFFIENLSGQVLTIP